MQNKTSPPHLTQYIKVKLMNHKRCQRRRFCYITLICYSSDRSLLWHYPLLLVRCAGIKWWWSARCVMRRARLCGWSVFRESGRFKGERHYLHAALCNSSFGNIHKEKKNMSDSWLPRATEWCFMEVLCLGSLNTFKTSPGKSLARMAADEMTSLIFDGAPRLQAS